MKLLTKAIEKQLAKYPIYSQDGKGGKAQVICKFFNPCGSQTWYILEGEKQDDDYILFALLDNMGERESVFRRPVQRQFRIRGGCGAELVFRDGVCLGGAEAIQAPSRPDKTSGDEAAIRPPRLFFVRSPARRSSRTAKRQTPQFGKRSGGKAT